MVASLAPSRLRPYRQVFGGDTNAAIKLYLIEMDLIAATQQLVAVVEVLMRESIHRELQKVYGPRWFSTERGRLDDRTRDEIRKARRFLRSPTPGQVVAEMTFGTWTYLLEPGGSIDKNTANERAADYESDLWVPAIQHAFNRDGGISREAASELARHVRWLRNRLSHRESFVFGVPFPGQTTTDAAGGLPIRQRPQHALDGVRSLARHLNPEVADWLARCTRADELLAAPDCDRALQHAVSSRVAHWV